MALIGAGDGVLDRADRPELDPLRMVGYRVGRDRDLSESVDGLFRILSNDGTILGSGVGASWRFHTSILRGVPSPLLRGVRARSCFFMRD